jgi:hypothetical protein
MVMSVFIGPSNESIRYPASETATSIYDIFPYKKRNDGELVAGEAPLQLPGCGISSMDLGRESAATGSRRRRRWCGSWDDGRVYRPFILQEGNLLRMWYSGWSAGGGNTAIGLATSGS